MQLHLGITTYGPETTTESLGGTFVEIDEIPYSMRALATEVDVTVTDADGNQHEERRFEFSAEARVVGNVGIRFIHDGEVVDSDLKHGTMRVVDYSGRRPRFSGHELNADFGAGEFVVVRTDEDGKVVDFGLADPTRHNAHYPRAVRLDGMYTNNLGKMMRHLAAHK